jgi:hypothetical protein
LGPRANGWKAALTLAIGRVSFANLMGAITVDRSNV